MRDTFSQQHPSHHPRSRWGFLWLSFSFLLLLLLSFIVYQYLKKPVTYQALFLKTGEVYFGKVSVDGPDQVSLSDAYYFRYDDSLTDVNAPVENGKGAIIIEPMSARVALVKRGSEAHRPDSTMHFVKNNVLFWEDLKTNSNIYQSIIQSH